MKRIMGMILMLVVILGMSFSTSAVDVPATFTWGHTVPDDIAKYTIYEIQDGNKQGQTFVYPYTYEGETEKNFSAVFTLTDIPEGVTVQKCFVITASDKTDNESADSAQACNDIFVKDSTPPGACTQFNFSTETP